MVKVLVAVVVLGMVARAHADDPVAPADGELSPPGMTPPRAAAPHGDGETPPLSGARIVGESLLGGVFGAGVGLFGALVGAGIEKRDGCSGLLCGVTGAVLGGGLGLTLGAPIGVYLAGSHSGETGSFGAALGGSAVGMVMGFGIAAATDGYGVPLLFVAPVAGAVIGFNATRRYDGPQPRPTVLPVVSATPERTTFGFAGTF